MRKLLMTVIIVLCAVTGVQAQHYIGVRAGNGAGLGRFAPREEMQMVWGVWSGGVAWKYYGPKKYVGAVGAEIEFLQRAYEYNKDRVIDADETYRRTINSINVPFIWHIHVNMMNDKFRVFLNLGVEVSYNFSSFEETFSKERGQLTHNKYEMTLVKDNPFGYGLMGGVGFNVVLGKIELMAEGRYHLAFGDVLRNRSVYMSDPYVNPNPRRSPVDNINISLGVFYRLGDVPHVQQPSPAALKRRADKEAQRLLKENGVDIMPVIEEGAEEVNEELLVLPSVPGEGSNVDIEDLPVAPGLNDAIDDRAEDSFIMPVTGEVLIDTENI